MNDIRRGCRSVTRHLVPANLLHSRLVAGNKIIILTPLIIIVVTYLHVSQPSNKFYKHFGTVADKSIKHHEYCGFGYVPMR